MYGRLALLLTLWFGATAPALADFAVPPLTGPVVDSAQILSSDATTRIDGALRYLRNQGGAQINVLTVPDIGDLSLEQASLQVVEKWQLGTKRLDNGVLLFIDVRGHGIRIEVGQGEEGDLPDAFAKRIIAETMTPLFRQQDFDDGVLLGVYEIAKRTNPKIDLSDFLEGRRYASRRTNARSSTSQLFMWFIILGFIIMILNRFGGGGPGGMRRGFLYGLGTGMASGGWGGGGWSGGGGGGGGGGWSGGGGGFSGGGASGQW